MPIPSYEVFLLPVLRLFADGAENVSECLPSLREQFGITDAEAEELIPSGRITTLLSRAHWARTYLSKAGLLTSPRRNLHIITERGRALLAQNPERLTVTTLSQFDGFEEWRTSGRKTECASELPVSIPSAEQTPEEAIASAHKALDAALRDELIEQMQALTPQRFEQLILDLLAKMGYGGGDLSNARLTSTTGDGGIDGIIHEDALGLDAVFIQAKRYATGNIVGRPAIQQFIGSLTGEGATKGVFVTTSDFSREARDYLRRVQHRVALIDGQQLAGLMIRHRVGVRVRMTYALSEVDENYFPDP